MKEPTMKEVLELVDFLRDVTGALKVCNVRRSIWGNVGGTVWGGVHGTVKGTIEGRKWEFVETPKEKAIRLIRERRYEEAIMALEESE
jgi:hypothetical protein